MWLRSWLWEIFPAFYPFQAEDLPRTAPWDSSRTHGRPQLALSAVDQAMNCVSWALIVYTQPHPVPSAECTLGK